jgi:hypothetical protein
MTRLLVRAIPWVVLIGLAYFAGCHYAKDRTAKAAIESQEKRIKAREVVISALAKQKAKVDTEYVAGKTVFVEAAKEWDEIKVTLGEKATIAGDKVVNSCKALVLSCDAKVAVRDTMLAQKDTIIWGKDSLLKAERKRGGSDWKTKLGYLLGGAAIGVLVPR